MLGHAALGEIPLGGFPQIAAAYALAIDPGSFTFTGVSVGIRAARSVYAGPGSYVLTGQSAGTIAARKLAFGTGAFTVTSVAAALRADRRIYPSPLTIAGNVQFGFAALGQVAFGQLDETSPQTISVSFQSARLAASHVPLAASTGVFALTGNAASLIRFLGTHVATGSFVLTGKAATLIFNRRLVARTGVFSESGQVIDLARRRKGLHVRPSGGQKLFVGAGGAAKGLRVRA